MADLVEGTYATGKGAAHPGHDCTPSVASSFSSGDDSPIDPILCQTSAPPVSASTLASSAPAMLPAPAPTSGKCQAADSFKSTSGKQVRHAHKKSGSQAIEDMASSIDWLASAVAVDAAVPSPACKRATIHAIEDDGNLSDNKQTQVFQIICKDTTFANTILAIHKKDAHTWFIKSELYPLLESD